jgi:carbonic anhydrase
LGLLRQGNERFVQGQILAPHRGLGRLKDTAGVQKPFAAFLSCADSRVPVEIIFDQGFGDVFIVRVAGNVASTAVIASLEFGCAVLGCKLLYVLGHTSCGAVKATMNPQAVPGVISSLYYHIRPAVENAKGDQDKAIEENVRIQCKSLGISPVITSLQEEGKLKVVGGIYDLATGKVREIDC